MHPNTEHEENRTYAREVLASSAPLGPALIAEHGSLSRWLLASLLALNGGALTFAKDFPATPSRMYAAAAFLLGVFGALATGFLNQRRTGELTIPVALLRDYWITVLIDGTRDDAMEKERSDALDIVQRRGWRGPTAGWLSATCFFLGVVLLLMIDRPIPVVTLRYDDAVFTADAIDLAVKAGLGPATEPTPALHQTVGPISSSHDYDRSTR